jgi:clan AA aspartic protease
VTVGEVRGGFPRVVIELPGHAGSVRVEFVLDTGFEGYLSLPASVVQRLDATYAGAQTSRLADGTEIVGPLYSLTLLWNGEPREVDVLVFENNPLLGVFLLTDCHLDIDMTEGGEVLIEFP